MAHTVATVSEMFILPPPPPLHHKRQFFRGKLFHCVQLVNCRRQFIEGRNFESSFSAIFHFFHYKRFSSTATRMSSYVGLSGGALVCFVHRNLSILNYKKLALAPFFGPHTYKRSACGVVLWNHLHQWRLDHMCREVISLRGYTYAPKVIHRVV
jgi:hypothetical protein